MSKGNRCGTGSAASDSSRSTTPRGSRTRPHERSTTHRHGIIHRDIKPENILLTADGDTLVADFGVGRALGAPEPGERLTEGGMVVGTPAYMSPEQAAGERELDGRTDVYSLGIVLHEMLAGEPPFTGPSPQAIVARRLSEKPRPLRQTRESVPPDLERVALRALARAPADRCTAAALAESLDMVRRSPTVAPDRLEATVAARPVPRFNRRWLEAAAALIVIAGAVWLLLRRKDSALPLDDSVVAVAPFEVLDPKLELWREGLVDLLSRNLDGAGPIRSVAPTVVIRRWRGRADPQSAGELGRATGAGLAVYGSLLAMGPDSVRLRATLLDVARGRPLEEWEVGDTVDRMDRLTDSLTFRVLRGLGRTQPIGAVRLAGLGSTNLPALKAFLQGEQFHRRSEWDSALVHYLRAVELDGAFPLALRRASSALGWSRNGFDSLSNALALRAGASNRGLAPRDSLLVAADSLMASLLMAGPLAVRADTTWGTRLRRLFGTLEHATARYPDDPETWFQLGEAENHIGPFAGRTLQQQLQAFDRAIALDSAFAPSYLHPIEMTAMLGAAEVKRYLDPYLALEPHDRYANGLRLVRGILDSAGPPAVSSSIQERRVAVTVLSRLADSAEVAVDILRRSAPAPEATHLSADDALAKRQLGRELMARGHLKEGRRALGDLPAAFYAEPAIFGAVPAETAAAEFRRQLSSGEPDAVSAALPWWTMRRDTVSISRAAARGDSLAGSGKQPVDRTRGRYLAAAAAAYLTLTRGDTGGAIERLATLNRDDCPRCYFDRLVHAQLLERQQRDQEAWSILRTEPPSASLAPFPSEVFWNLLRGRVAERIGERDQAARSYAWVVGMWRRPDLELQPYLVEAREGLARLTGEKR